MELFKKIGSKLSEANEALAASQKKWRDEGLTERENAVLAREHRNSELEAEMSSLREKLSKLEIQKNRQKYMYLLAIIAASIPAFLIGNKVQYSKITTLFEFLSTNIKHDSNSSSKNAELALSDVADSPSNNEDTGKMIESSDNYSIYSQSFARATDELVVSGRCTRHDFEEIGGWVKSTTDYKDEPVYFTYCGGQTISNRIYLNAVTGQIF